MNYAIISLEVNMEQKLTEIFSNTLNTAANALDCFRLIDEFNISTENKADHFVRIFALNYNKDHFDYEALYRLLKNNVANYVFNRKKVLEYEKKGEQVLSARDAIDKFVKISKDAIEKKNYGSGGELGEMLLYVFLEGFQKANKLLSKMELKTNNNTYAHGFDGVHFYLKKYETYSAFQLIYGESKIEDKLSDALREAFISLKTSYGNKSTDLSLLDDSILNEVVEDNDTIEFLKSIIIPRYRPANCKMETEDAFAMFLGYTFSGIMIDGTRSPKDLVDEKIKYDIRNLRRNLATKIKEMELPRASDFYIFVLPFNNAVVDKHNIMKEVLGVDLCN